VEGTKVDKYTVRVNYKAGNVCRLYVERGENEFEPKKGGQGGIRRRSNMNNMHVKALLSRRIMEANLGRARRMKEGH